MKRKIKTTDCLMAIVMFLIALCFGAVLASTYTYADDPVSSTASANASVTVAEACTLTVNNVTPHTTTLTNNNTAEDVGSTTFTATCNDPSGLAIYAVGYSNDEFGNTNLIGSSGSIATGTDDSSSNWSLKLNNLDGYTAPDFLQSSYTAVPSTYAKVAARNSNTTSATSFGVNTTYRFHISATQPANTYTGKVKYIMVHPASEVPPQPQTTQSGKICYYPNGSAVVGTMGCQDIASSVTLLASNFSRSGYGFAGWNTEFDYSGTFYGPNETISLNTADYTGDNNGLSLYAVWVKSQGSLQDSSKVAQLCGTGGTGGSLATAPIDGTANLSSVSALTDQRDNQTYAIARLADGKCWMIENMRLADKDSSNNDIELSATNTNNPSLPITNIYDATNPTTSNHLSASMTPSSSTPWCTANSAACYDQSMLYTGNTTERGTNPATSANTYSYGNYYNWYSATAGNGKYSTSTNNSTVAGDICPTGWTLPESGDKTNMAAEKNDFYKLGLSLGLSAPANYSSSSYPYWTGSPEGSNASIAFRTYPNNFLYSGNVHGSSVSHRGSYGYYGSKSAYNSYYAYYLGFGGSSSNVHPSSLNGYNKNSGFSVRCLAQ